MGGTDELCFVKYITYKLKVILFVPDIYKDQAEGKRGATFGLDEVCVLTCLVIIYFKILKVKVITNASLYPFSLSKPQCIHKKFGLYI